MNVIDEKARVFGRYNVVDVAVAVFVIGLIPLSYGAFVLFRVPVPKLTAVSPVTRPLDSEFRLVVQGENLRPYMRVSLNEMQGRAFFFKSDTLAEVSFGDIPPGQYDVVLYDNVQERSRLAKAFTLTAAPLPPAEVDVPGFLTSLDAELAKTIQPGFAFNPVGTVVAVGKPAADIARVASAEKTLELPIAKTFRLPVLLRVRCDVVSGSNGYGACVAGQVLAQNVYLKLPLGTTFVPFLIAEVRPAVTTTPIEVDVALTPGDAAIPVIQAGDVDIGYLQNEFAGGARVIRLSGNRVRLKLPAYPTLTGWVYGGQAIRIGASLLFLAQRYQVTGTIVSAPPPVPLTR